MNQVNSGNALKIVDLKKTYRGKRGRQVEALKGISLSIGRGEVFGFLGPNGAGKSTTIKILMGLIKATSGSASISGRNVSSVHARRQVGYLPENPSFYDYLSAVEYLSFVGRTFKMPPSQVDERSERILRRLDLWEARKRPVRSYSKGMVQRLGIAQALLHDPEVYILDEPMSGLDPVGRAQVKEIILELKGEGKSVFFSTHITADVETVCDRIGILAAGALRGVEDVQAILVEGIRGYRVHLKNARGELSQVQVSKEDLSHFLSTARERGDEISLVEPERKNIESVFLDLIKGKK